VLRFLPPDERAESLTKTTGLTSPEETIVSGVVVVDGACVGLFCELAAISFSF
jgi:hypothetical protein